VQLKENQIGMFVSFTYNGKTEIIYLYKDATTLFTQSEIEFAIAKIKGEAWEITNPTATTLGDAWAGYDYLSKNGFSGLKVWLEYDEATGKEVIYFTHPNFKTSTGRIYPFDKDGNAIALDRLLKIAKGEAIELSESELTGDALTAYNHLKNNGFSGLKVWVEFDEATGKEVMYFTHPNFKTQNGRIYPFDKDGNPIALDRLLKTAKGEAIELSESELTGNALAAYNHLKNNGFSGLKAWVEYDEAMQKEVMYFTHPNFKTPNGRVYPFDKEGNPIALDRLLKTAKGEAIELSESELTGDALVAYNHLKNNFPGIKAYVKYDEEIGKDVMYFLIDGVFKFYPFDKDGKFILGDYLDRNGQWLNNEVKRIFFERLDGQIAAVKYNLENPGSNTGAYIHVTPQDDARLKPLSDRVNEILDSYRNGTLTEQKLNQLSQQRTEKQSYWNAARIALLVGGGLLIIGALVIGGFTFAKAASRVLLAFPAVLMALGLTGALFAIFGNFNKDVIIPAQTSLSDELVSYAAMEAKVKDLEPIVEDILDKDGKKVGTKITRVAGQWMPGQGIRQITKEEEEQGYGKEGDFIVQYYTEYIMYNGEYSQSWYVEYDNGGGRQIYESWFPEDIDNLIKKWDTSTISINGLSTDSENAVRKALSNDFGGLELYYIADIMRNNYTAFQIGNNMNVVIEGTGAERTISVYASDGKGGWTLKEKGRFKFNEDGRGYITGDALYINQNTVKTKDGQSFISNIAFSYAGHKDGFKQNLNDPDTGRFLSYIFDNPATGKEYKTTILYGQYGELAYISKTIGLMEAYKEAGNIRGLRDLLSDPNIRSGMLLREIERAIQDLTAQGVTEGADSTFEQITEYVDRASQPGYVQSIQSARVVDGRLKVKNQNGIEDDYISKGIVWGEPADGNGDVYTYYQNYKDVIKNAKLLGANTVRTYRLPIAYVNGKIDWNATEEMLRAFKDAGITISVGANDRDLSSGNLEEFIKRFDNKNDSSKRLGVVLQYLIGNEFNYHYIDQPVRGFEGQGWFTKQQWFDTLSKAVDVVRANSNTIVGTVSGEVPDAEHIQKYLDLGLDSVQLNVYRSGTDYNAITETRLAFEKAISDNKKGKMPYLGFAEIGANQTDAYGASIIAETLLKHPEVGFYYFQLNDKTGDILGDFGLLDKNGKQFAPFGILRNAFRQLPDSGKNILGNAIGVVSAQPSTSLANVPNDAYKFSSMYLTNMTRSSLGDMVPSSVMYLSNGAAKSEAEFYHESGMSAPAQQQQRQQSEPAYVFESAPLTGELRAQDIWREIYNDEEALRAFADVYSEMLGGYRFQGNLNNMSLEEANVIRSILEYDITRFAVKDEELFGNLTENQIKEKLIAEAREIAQNYKELHEMGYKITTETATLSQIFPNGKLPQEVIDQLEGIMVNGRPINLSTVQFVGVRRTSAKMGDDNIIYTIRGDSEQRNIIAIQYGYNGRIDSIKINYEFLTKEAKKQNPVLYRYLDINSSLKGFDIVYGKKYGYEVSGDYEFVETVTAVEALDSKNLGRNVIEDFKNKFSEQVMGRDIYDVMGLNRERVFVEGSGESAILIKSLSTPRMQTGDGRFTQNSGHSNEVYVYPDGFVKTKEIITKYAGVNGSIGDVVVVLWGLNVHPQADGSVKYFTELKGESGNIEKRDSPLGVEPGYFVLKDDDHGKLKDPEELVVFKRYVGADGEFKGEMGVEYDVYRQRLKKNVIYSTSGKLLGERYLYVLAQVMSGIAGSALLENEGESGMETIYFNPANMSFDQAEKAVLRVSPEVADRLLPGWNTDEIKAKYPELDIKTENGLVLFTTKDNYEYTFTTRSSAKDDGVVLRALERLRVLFGAGFIDGKEQIVKTKITESEGMAIGMKNETVKIYSNGRMINIYGVNIESTWWNRTVPFLKYIVTALFALIAGSWIAGKIATFSHKKKTDKKDKKKKGEIGGYNDYEPGTDKTIVKELMLQFRDSTGNPKERNINDDLIDDIFVISKDAASKNEASRVISIIESIEAEVSDLEQQKINADKLKDRARIEKSITLKKEELTNAKRQLLNVKLNAAERYLLSIYKEDSHINVGNLKEALVKEFKSTIGVSAISAWLDENKEIKDGLYKGKTNEQIKADINKIIKNNNFRNSLDIKEYLVREYLIKLGKFGFEANNPDTIDLTINEWVPKIRTDLARGLSISEITMKEVGRYMNPYLEQMYGEGRIRHEYSLKQMYIKYLIEKNAFIFAATNGNIKHYMLENIFRAIEGDEKAREQLANVENTLELKKFKKEDIDAKLKDIRENFSENNISLYIDSIVDTFAQIVKLNDVAGFGPLKMSFLKQLRNMGIISNMQDRIIYYDVEDWFRTPEFVEAYETGDLKQKLNEYITNQGNINNRLESLAKSVQARASVIQAAYPGFFLSGNLILNDGSIAGTNEFSKRLLFTQGKELKRLAEEEKGKEEQHVTELVRSIEDFQKALKEYSSLDGKRGVKKTFADLTGGKGGWRGLVVFSYIYLPQIMAPLKVAGIALSIVAFSIAVLASFSMLWPAIILGATIVLWLSDKPLNQLFETWVDSIQNKANKEGGIYKPLLPQDSKFVKAQKNQEYEQRKIRNARIFGVVTAVVKLLWNVFLFGFVAVPFLTGTTAVWPVIGALGLIIGPLAIPLMIIAPIILFSLLDAFGIKDILFSVIGYVKAKSIGVYSIKKFGQLSDLQEGPDGKKDTKFHLAQERVKLYLIPQLTTDEYGFKRPLTEDEKNIAAMKMHNLIYLRLRIDDKISMEELREYLYKVIDENGQERYIGVDGLKSFIDDAKIWNNSANYLEMPKYSNGNNFTIIEPNIAVAPRNEEAADRLNHFYSTLFMDLENTQVWENLAQFSGANPTNEEVVIYPWWDKDGIKASDYDGLLTLQKDGYVRLNEFIKDYPDEWENFVERLYAGKIKDIEGNPIEITAQLRDSLLSLLQPANKGVNIAKGDSKKGIEGIGMELTPLVQQIRLWASFRYQPASRTIRGNMNYRNTYDFFARVNYPTAQSLDVDQTGYDREIARKVGDKFEYTIQQSPFFDNKTVAETLEEYKKFISGNLKDSEALKLIKSIQDHLKFPFFQNKTSVEILEVYKKFISGNLKDSEVQELIKLIKDHLNDEVNLKRAQQYYDMTMMPALYPGLKILYDKNGPFGPGQDVGLVELDLDENGRVQFDEYGVVKLKQTAVIHPTDDLQSLIAMGKTTAQNSIFRLVRGEVVQMMDMNQDIDFEETFKQPGLMNMFFRDPSLVILGYPERIFTDKSTVGAAHAFGDHTFAAFTQRVADVLGVRFHYGHPDWVRKTAFTTIGLVMPVNVNEDIEGAYKAIVNGGHVEFVESVRAAKGREGVLQGFWGINNKFGSGGMEQAMTRHVARLNVADNWFSRASIHALAGIGFYLKQLIVPLTIMTVLLITNLLGLSAFVAVPSVILFGFLALLQSQSITLPGLVNMIVEKGFVKGMLAFLKTIISTTIAYGAIDTNGVYQGVKAGLTGKASYVATGRILWKHLALYEAGKENSETPASVYAWGAKARNIITIMNFLIIGSIVLWFNVGIIWSLPMFIIPIMSVVGQAILNPAGTPFQTKVDDWNKTTKEDVKISNDKFLNYKVFVPIAWIVGAVVAIIFFPALTAFIVFGMAALYIGAGKIIPFLFGKIFRDTGAKIKEDYENWIGMHPFWNGVFSFITMPLLGYSHFNDFKNGVKGNVDFRESVNLMLNMALMWFTMWFISPLAFIFTEIAYFWNVKIRGRSASDFEQKQKAKADKTVEEADKSKQKSEDEYQKYLELQETDEKSANKSLAESKKAAKKAESLYKRAEKERLSASRTFFGAVRENDHKPGFWAAIVITVSVFLAVGIAIGGFAAVAIIGIVSFPVATAIYLLLTNLKEDIGEAKKKAEEAGKKYEEAKKKAEEARKKYEEAKEKSDKEKFELAISDVLKAEVDVYKYGMPLAKGNAIVQLQTNLAKAISDIQINDEDSETIIKAKIDALSNAIKELSKLNKDAYIRGILKTLRAKVEALNRKGDKEKFDLAMVDIFKAEVDVYKYSRPLAEGDSDAIARLQANLTKAISDIQINDKDSREVIQAKISAISNAAKELNKLNKDAYILQILETLTYIVASYQLGKDGVVNLRVTDTVMEAVVNRLQAEFDVVASGNASQVTLTLEAPAFVEQAEAAEDKSVAALKEALTTYDSSAKTMDDVRNLQQTMAAVKINPKDDVNIGIARVNALADAMSRMRYEVDGREYGFDEIGVLTWKLLTLNGLRLRKLSGVSDKLELGKNWQPIAEDETFPLAQNLMISYNELKEYIKDKEAVSMIYLWLNGGIGASVKGREAVIYALKSWKDALAKAIEKKDRIAVERLSAIAKGNDIFGQGLTDGENIYGFAKINPFDFYDRQADGSLKAKAADAEGKIEITINGTIVKIKAPVLTGKATDTPLVDAINGAFESIIALKAQEFMYHANAGVVQIVGAGDEANAKDIQDSTAGGINNPELIGPRLGQDIANGITNSDRIYPWKITKNATGDKEYSLDFDSKMTHASHGPVFFTMASRLIEAYKQYMKANGLSFKDMTPEQMKEAMRYFGDIVFANGDGINSGPKGRKGAISMYAVPRRAIDAKGGAFVLLQEAFIYLLELANFTGPMTKVFEKFGLKDEYGKNPNPFNTNTSQWGAFEVGALFAELTTIIGYEKTFELMAPPVIFVESADGTKVDKNEWAIGQVILWTSMNLEKLRKGENPEFTKKQAEEVNNLMNNLLGENQPFATLVVADDNQREEIGFTPYKFVTDIDLFLFGGEVREGQWLPYDKVNPLSFSFSGDMSNYLFAPYYYWTYLNTSELNNINQVGEFQISNLALKGDIELINNSGAAFDLNSQSIEAAGYGSYFEAGNIVFVQQPVEKPAPFDLNPEVGYDGYFNPGNILTNVSITISVDGREISEVKIDGKVVDPIAASKSIDVTPEQQPDVIWTMNINDLTEKDRSRLSRLSSKTEINEGHDAIQFTVKAENYDLFKTEHDKIVKAAEKAKVKAAERTRIATEKKANIEAEKITLLVGYVSSGTEYSSLPEFIQRMPLNTLKARISRLERIGYTDKNIDNLTAKEFNRINKEDASIALRRDVAMSTKGAITGEAAHNTSVAIVNSFGGREYIVSEDTYRGSESRLFLGTGKNLQKARDLAAAQRKAGYAGVVVTRAVVRPKTGAIRNEATGEFEYRNVRIMANTTFEYQGKTFVAEHYIVENEDGTHEIQLYLRGKDSAGTKEAAAITNDNFITTAFYALAANINGNPVLQGNQKGFGIGKVAMVDTISENNIDVNSIDGFSGIVNFRKYLDTNELGITGESDINVINNAIDTERIHNNAKPEQWSSCVIPARFTENSMIKRMNTVVNANEATGLIVNAEGRITVKNNVVEVNPEFINAVFNLKAQGIKVTLVVDASDTNFEDVIQKLFELGFDGVSLDVSKLNNAGIKDALAALSKLSKNNKIPARNNTIKTNDRQADFIETEKLANGAMIIGDYKRDAKIDPKVTRQDKSFRKGRRTAVESKQITAFTFGSLNASDLKAILDNPGVSRQDLKAFLENSKANPVIMNLVLKKIFSDSLEPLRDAGQEALIISEAKGFIKGAAANYMEKLWLNALGMSLERYVQVMNNKDNAQNARVREYIGEALLDWQGAANQENMNRFVEALRDSSDADFANLTINDIAKLMDDSFDEVVNKGEFTVAGVKNKTAIAAASTLTAAAMSKVDFKEFAKRSTITSANAIRSVLSAA